MHVYTPKVKSGLLSLKEFALYNAYSNKIKMYTRIKENHHFSVSNFSCK